MRQFTRRQFAKSLVLTSSAAVIPKVQAKKKDKRPNILFFFPDQHRFDFLGTNPRLPIKTPHLEALANQGVLFRHAICPSPLCAPSRACLASGQHYDRAGVANNKFDYPLTKPTFYQMLGASGYHVAGCGKFDLHKASHSWGIEGKHLLPEWGFSDGIDNAGKWDAINSYRKAGRAVDPYMFYLQENDLVKIHITDFAKRHSKNATFPTPLPEKAYCDNWVAAQGLQLMQNFPENNPWFLQVNFTGPHSPWDITQRMDKICRKRTFPQPNHCKQFTANEHNAIRQNYAAMIENIDRWLGVFINMLKKRSDFENTIIVFSSDHGEMLGDHNLWGKVVPFHPSVSVPLIIAGPNVRQNHVSNALVNTMDLAATFLDFAGIAATDEMDSRSLLPLLSGSINTHRKFVYSGLDEWRMVFDGRYKLIRGFSGKKIRGEKVIRYRGNEVPPMMFDLQSDPLENENLAGINPAELNRLDRMLQTVHGLDN